MKKLTIIGLGLALFALTWIIDSCRKNDVNPEVPDQEFLPFEVPAGFPPLPDKIKNSMPTRAGFELGRRLFYDGRLSRDGQFACASCHQQFAAFSTFDHPLSHGIDDQFTTRNAPGLFNLAWYDALHWDGGINHIEVQPLAPIMASNEMGETMDNIIRKLQADSTYPRQFRASFGTEEINTQRILKALAQFQIMMVSADSKYDRVKAGKTSFTVQEERGYTVFKAKCATCHQEPLFTDQTFRNTGLSMHSQLKDLGRMRITGKATDSLAFRVPSLRNLFLTAPYGHDGRFYAVSAVIDHYRSGLVKHPSTDPLVRERLAISDQEKFELQQFLRTLTDSSFIKDTRFSQPR